MQSYQLHIVSEHLKDRHPYLEAEFRDRYDPTQVTLAVFDRSIPKLVEIILMPDIEEFKYRDAIRTLNELVSHQENKSNIIDSNIHSRLFSFLRHTNIDIRRETILLLGSLFTVERGRRKIDAAFFAGVEAMLFEESRETREACAWCLNRVASGRDGVQLMITHGIVRVMINAYHRFSKLDAPNFVAETKFVILLLEAFQPILLTDDGIAFFLGTKTIKWMNDILRRLRQAPNLLHQMTGKVCHLTLAALGKLAVNPKAKAECIEEGVIFTANSFLVSHSESEVFHALETIMFCTILLEGKNQCVGAERDEILLQIIKLLHHSNVEIVKLAKQTLVNIADLPLGFAKIAGHMSVLIDLLDDIFGTRAVSHLAKLLPNPIKAATPPLLPAERQEEAKNVMRALGHFIRKYDDAIVVAVEECVKITEKIAPFLLLRDDKALQDLVAAVLIRICSKDEYNQSVLVEFIRKFEHVKHPIHQTTLPVEIKRYPRLAELLIPK
eukprot:TRINITY_DN24717_c0_g1_i2.p1 TRINITY_DN24717_c0_g1~~TRINITY_DN24717_c0_g1_i2.p1  ORF type:complete len:497 (+),score=80.92 TRINITY_DN24717_c0_g1_i2:36-1526(+)